MFVDRRRRAGRWLEWKVALFSVAAILATVGIALEERWMTGVAIAVLAGAMGLRFLPGGSERARMAEDEDEELGEAGDLDGARDREDSAYLGDRAATSTRGEEER